MNCVATFFYTPEYSLISDDYESIVANTRDDETDSSNVGVKYIPNRNLEVSFQLENTNQNSHE